MYFLFELMLYVPVNNFSAMSGCVLGLTSILNNKQRIKYLAQGHDIMVPPIKQEPATS